VEDNLKPEIDKVFKYYSKSDGYDWVKFKSFKIPEYSMQDYLNMFLKTRPVKLDGKFYDSFEDLISKKAGEVTKSLENMFPLPEKDAMVKGYGWTKYTAIRQRQVKYRIPFVPSTYDTVQEMNLIFLSPQKVLSITKGYSKGVPGGDCFHVLCYISGTEHQNPNYVIVEMSYCMIFTSSTFLEGTIRKYAPSEIEKSFEDEEELMLKVVHQNKPNVIEKDPRQKTEANYVYDKKMLHSVQFKNMKDRSDELFASVHSQRERQEREEKASKRRYLGEYDKRAIYHSGPEALNPDYEDIFNVRRVNQNKVEEAVDYLMTIKDKNLGLVEEITEKQKVLLSKVKKNPNKYIDQMKMHLKDPKVLFIIFIAIMLFVLKIYDF
jgi:hypothetical protein